MGLIDWTNIPAGQEVEIYLPGVDAEEVLATASELDPTHRLVRVDGHTLGCLTGGVTYIPLPPGTGDGANFAGLMAIALPEGIRHGQLYTAVVQQLTNAATQDVEERERISVADVAETVPLHWRRVLGTFQINIPVSTKSALLEKEEVLLSIFRWVGESIPWCIAGGTRSSSATSACSRARSQDLAATRLTSSPRPTDMTGYQVTKGITAGRRPTSTRQR